MEKILRAFCVEANVKQKTTNLTTKALLAIKQEDNRNPPTPTSHKQRLYYMKKFKSKQKSFDFAFFFLYKYLNEFRFLIFITLLPYFWFYPNFCLIFFFFFFLNHLQ